MKTIKGMTSEEQQAVEEILAPYINDYSFYYYGSRVKGNFSNLSDLAVDNVYSFIYFPLLIGEGLRVRFGFY